MADRYYRFTPGQRVDHVVQIVTFTVLAVTGIVQRYPGSGLSRGVIDLLGGIETTRVIHRVFATLLMIGVVAHLGGIGYRRVVLGRKERMVPGLSDVRAGFQSLAFGLRLRDQPPRQGRYTWVEKAEYWSLVWGTVIMIVTGFLLWNPIATARLLPGDFIPAAKAAHSGEALLAILAVIVWHVYHVHVRQFNKSMFTGHLSRREMEEEHPLELAEIERGSGFRPPSPEVKQRRARLFFPVYGAVAVLLLFGIYEFVSFEETAIETIEPISDVRVFAPADTTTTTVPPGTTTTTTTPDGEPVAATWDGGIGDLLAGTCGACHSASQQFGGVDLSTYTLALGWVVPGDPESSPLYSVQAAGGHPGQLDEVQVEQLRTWIANGALEAEGAAAPPVGEAGPRWDDLGVLFARECVACHNTGQPSGGVNLARYREALGAVVPGDPESSPLYSVQAAGGHPGQLDEEAVELLGAWIGNGAPQHP